MQICFHPVNTMIIILMLEKIDIAVYHYTYKTYYDCGGVSVFIPVLQWHLYLSGMTVMCHNIHPLKHYFLQHNTRLITFFALVVDHFHTTVMTVFK